MWDLILIVLKGSFSLFWGHQVFERLVFLLLFEDGFRVVWVIFKRQLLESACDDHSDIGDTEHHFEIFHGDLCKKDAIFGVNEFDSDLGHFQVDLEGELFHFLGENCWTNSNFRSQLFLCDFIVLFEILLSFFFIVRRWEEEFHNPNDSFGFVVDDQLTEWDVNFSVGVLILWMFFIYEGDLDVYQLLGFWLDVSLEEFL